MKQLFRVRSLPWTRSVKQRSFWGWFTPASCKVMPRHASFDQFIGLGEQPIGHGETKRFGRL